MTQIWSHRGATEYAPENTLQSFEKAVHLGVSGIELDVQRSRDGVLVVIHDETVDRTSDGTGKVAELTFDELLRFDFSRGIPSFQRTQIPSLDEVLDFLAPTDVTINIELKNGIEPYPGLPLETASIVEQHGLAERVTYSSFNHYGLAELRRSVPSRQLGLLYVEWLWEPWRYAREFGAGAVHPGLPALTDPDLVRRCHAAGVAVNVWTVNQDSDIARLAKLEVDAIITDRPELALRVLADT